MKTIIDPSNVATAILVLSLLASLCLFLILYIKSSLKKIEEEEFDSYIREAFKLIEETNS